MPAIDCLAYQDLIAILAPFYVAASMPVLSVSLRICVCDIGLYNFFRLLKFSRLQRPFSNLQAIFTPDLCDTAVKRLQINSLYPFSFVKRFFQTAVVVVLLSHLYMLRFFSLFLSFKLTPFNEHFYSWREQLLYQNDTLNSLIYKLLSFYDLFPTFFD